MRERGKPNALTALRGRPTVRKEAADSQGKAGQESEGMWSPGASSARKPLALQFCFRVPETLHQYDLSRLL